MGEGAVTKYSISSIHCPVDIRVLDKNGGLAARTDGEQVYYSEGANLRIFVCGEEKYVYVPNGIEYSIVFVGTGSGIMSYTQQTMNGDKVLSEKTFDDVRIEPNKLLYAHANTNKASKQVLSVLDQDGVAIKNISIDGEESNSVINFSWLGWLFIALDAVSLTAFVISIKSIVKKE